MEQQTWCEYTQLQPASPLRNYACRSKLVKVHASMEGGSGQQTDVHYRGMDFLAAASIGEIKAIAESFQPSIVLMPKVASVLAAQREHGVSQVC